MNFYNYIFQNYQQVYGLLIEHIYLTLIAVFFSIIIGVPIGILICYVNKLNKPILGVTSVLQAIPSMALLGFMIPLLGIGKVPAVVVVVLYSLLPIIKNTYTGLVSINPQTIEAAKGIGLTNWQILRKVQIPMALPIIMAGVRISIVTAVGLMTIAAFIGAGGLGYLVFSGIRTVNTGQILAGAVPACALALLVDYLAANIEKLVTPISLQNLGNKSLEMIAKTRFKQKITVATATLLFGVILMPATLATFTPKAIKEISIGSKDFTEQQILGHMFADLVEAKTDIKVKREINLGGTQVCFEAMKNNNIDMYIEYTGTIYGNILRHPPISDMQKVYDISKNTLQRQYNIVVMPQIAFNNTYTLAVTKELATKYNLEKISDLRENSANFRTGTTLEFLNRKDGLPGVKQKYNLTFKDSIGLDGSPRYSALTNNDVEIIDAFSTDGLLKKFDLVTLKDDKKFFPPYYAVPLIRKDTLDKFPELEEVVNSLAGVLTEEVMIELNYQVDEKQKQPEAVAREFLKKNGLI